jgi:hypothetical protein
VTAADVRSQIRQEIARAGGLRALAHEWSVDPGMMSRILSGDGESIPPVLLAPLGLTKVVQTTTLYLPR